MFALLNVFTLIPAQHLNSYVMAFMRYLAGTLLLLPLIVRLGTHRTFHSYRKGLHVARGVIHASGMFLWFAALPLISLAELTALGFTGPIFVTLGAVLFLGAVVVLRLLARQQLALALFGSGIIFALGQLFYRFWSNSAVGLGLYFYWPSWQLAFTASLVIGWHWESRQISVIVTHARTLLIAGGVIAVGDLLGGLAHQGTVWGTTVAPWTIPFGEYNLGFGAFILGVAVLVVAYNAAQFALAQQNLKVGAKFLERLGTRSLACFVISSLVLFVQVAFLPYPPNAWWGALMTAMSLALGWLWATWRQRTTRLR